MKNSNPFLIMFIVGVLFSLGRGVTHIYSWYQYSNTVESNWTLAERASTIAQKSEYIDKYVKALEASNLHGTSSALVFQTPRASFDENFKALTSLQKRLKDISAMDETSFAYQTAIQQITAQEQGEGSGVTGNLESCWMRQNWYSLWNPLIVGFCVILEILLIGIPIKRWMNFI